MQNHIRLATIYRHRLFQDCLRGVLSRDRRYRVSPFEHASPTVIEQLREAGADVVIIDASLPNGRGLELIRAIRRQLEGVRVLAIASTATRGELLACIEAGANGCILEEASIDDLKSAVDTVLRGESYCTSQATEIIFSQIAAAAAESSGRMRLPEPTLTTREREVLEMLADGYSNKQIAQELHLSLYTVKNHVHNLLDKLPVSTRHEAAHLARQQRWVTV